MDAYRPLPGTPVDDLDTPCLLIDLVAVENNYGVVAETYRDTVCKMRQHTKNIKSPRLARMQIEEGGTLGGVCTAKVSEAEVMVEGGVTDVLVANQVARRDKIARLCALARRAEVKVCADNAGNLHDLSEIASEHGVSIGVLVEINTAMGRAGARSPEQAVALAKLANELPGIDFKGVMSHQSSEEKDREARAIIARDYIQICLDAAAAVEQAGIPVEVVSTGETFSYDAAARIPGVTEVEGGTYALMCTRYSFMEEFQVANKVLCTVVSTPNPGVALADVGSRAMTIPAGDPPAVEGRPGVTVETLLDEHTVLRVDDGDSLSIGDKLILLPYYQDMLVNRWDQYIAVRDGVVEEVWDIPGRGCAQ